MRSAQEISNSTSTIFSNIYNQAHDVVEAIRASQAEKSRQLDAFEMKFKVSWDKLLKTSIIYVLRGSHKLIRFDENRKRLKERRNKP